MITSPIKRDKPTIGEQVRMDMVSSHKPDSLSPVAQDSVYSDQRFADMRDGKRGVTQPPAQIASSPIGVAERMGPGSGTITDSATGRQVRMDREGNTKYFDAGGNSIDKFTIGRKVMDAGNLGSTPNNPNAVLASRQPGQAVRYNNGGLNVEFAGNTPNSEIGAFTNSHRGLVTERQRGEKAYAEMMAKKQAMNGGLGEGPSRPVMPNLSGLGPDEIKAQVDAYQAQQATYDNFHQNATNRMNNESDNVNKAEQNKYMKDYYGGSVKNDTEKTQAMVNSSKLEDVTTERANSIRDQLMADPNNKDLQRKFEILTGKQPTRDYKADQRNKMISEIMGQTGITGEQIGYSDAARVYDIDQANLSGDPDEIAKANKKYMAPEEAEAYDKMDDITKSLFIQMDPEQKKLFLSTAK
jgi:hypothetical protein